MTVLLSQPYLLVLRFVLSMSLMIFSILFIVNCAILIDCTIFRFSVLFFFRWHCFLNFSSLFLSFESLFHWSYHMLRWYSYISLKSVPLLLSSSYLNYPCVQCNIVLTFQLSSYFLFSNNEKLEISGHVLIDCYFVVLMFLLCFMPLFNKSIFLDSPSSSTFAWLLSL